MWRVAVLCIQSLQNYETDWFCEVRRLVECPKASRPMRKHKATCCTSKKKECRISRMKSNWQNCVQMQDLSKQLALDNPSWQRILIILRIWWSYGLSRMHTSSKRRIINSKRMDSWEIENWSCIGRYDQIPSRKAGGLRSAFILYPELDLIRGSEFWTVSTNSRETWRRRHELLVRTTRTIQMEQGHLLSKKRESWNILGLRQTNM